MPSRDEIDAPQRPSAPELSGTSEWVRRATWLTIAIQLGALCAGLVVALDSGLHPSPHREISAVEDFGLMFAIVWPIGVILSAHQWPRRPRFLYLHLAGAPLFAGVILYSINVLSAQF